MAYFNIMICASKWVNLEWVKAGKIECSFTFTQYEPHVISKTGWQVPRDSISIAKQRAAWLTSPVYQPVPTLVLHHPSSPWGRAAVISVINAHIECEWGLGGFSSQNTHTQTRSHTRTVYTLIHKWSLLGRVFFWLTEFLWKQVSRTEKELINSAKYS